MSKNTNIADLINYISVDGSGNVVLTTGGQVATQSYVTTAVSNLVNSAPSTLDTLNELAAALGNDANFATTVTNSIATKLPLSGGTLTGALSGTSASFSGALEAGKLGGAVTVGDLFVDSANNSVYVGRQSSTSGDNSKFYVRNRLNTLTALSVDPGGNGAVDVVGTFSSTRGTNLATATGNVGVGVVNPTGTYSKLSVAGGISILDDNNAKLEIGRYSSGAPNSYIKIGTNSGSLRITNAADTIDLVSFLNSGFTFFGNIPSFTDYIKYNFNVGTDQNIGFRSSASIARLEATNDAVTANVPMEFAASRFIFTGGNVGIGTSSPQTPLQILKDTNTNGTNIEEANMAFSVLSASGQSKIAIGACNAGNYGYIQVMQDATSWTNRNLTLQPRGGSVGVGTYTPSDKLQVVGSLRWGSATNNLVSFADGGGVYMELSAPNSSTRNLRIQGINNAGNKYSAIRLEAGIEEIAFVTADVERMRISSPGDLYLYNGSIQQQGVWTVFNTGYTDGTSSFNFDISVGDEGGGGNIFKVEAGFAHYFGMAYNCLAEFYISTRGTGSEITDVIRRDTSLAGSFTAWKTTSTVLRVNKSAGTYPGGGRYWIKVTKVNY